MIFHSTKPPEALQRAADGKRAARGGNPRENSRRIRQPADLKPSQRKSFSAGIFSGRASRKGRNENARGKSSLPSAGRNLKVSLEKHFNFAPSSAAVFARKLGRAASNSASRRGEGRPVRTRGEKSATRLYKALI